MGVGSDTVQQPLIDKSQTNQEATPTFLVCSIVSKYWQINGKCKILKRLRVPICLNKVEKYVHTEWLKFDNFYKISSIDKHNFVSYSSWDT